MTSPSRPMTVVRPPRGIGPPPRGLCGISHPHGEPPRVAQGRRETVDATAGSGALLPCDIPGASVRSSLLLSAQLQ